LPKKNEKVKKMRTKRKKHRVTFPRENCPTSPVRGGEGGGGTELVVTYPKKSGM